MISPSHCKIQNGLINVKILRKPEQTKQQGIKKPPQFN